MKMRNIVSRLVAVVHWYVGTELPQSTGIQYGRGHTFHRIAASAAVSLIVACSASSDSLEPTGQPIRTDTVRLGLNDFELASFQVFTGQEAIDVRRAWAQRDLAALLQEDPNHPDAERIRKRLADIDGEERYFHWRVASGFQNPDGTYRYPESTYRPPTPEEYWRKMIEDRDLLGLTAEEIMWIETELGRLARQKKEITTLDDTIAASDAGTQSVFCTTDATLGWETSGNLFYDQTEDELRSVQWNGRAGCALHLGEYIHTNTLV